MYRVKVLAVDPASRGGLLWHPPSGTFGYSCGDSLVMEGLASRQQTVLTGLPSRAGCVCQSGDGTVVAAGCAAAPANSSAATIALWRLADGAWQYSAALDFAGMPVLALALSDDGGYLAAVGCPGASPLRVTVSVWGVRHGVPEPQPLASRSVVLSAGVSDLSDDGGLSAIVTSLHWATSSRFMAVGGCGVVEFEVVEDVDVSAVTSALSSFSLRYRTVVDPALVTAADGSAVPMTAAAFQTSVPSDAAAGAGAGAGAAGGAASGVLQHSARNLFASSDGAGNIYVVSPDATSDAYEVVKHSPPERAGAVHHLNWRGDVLIAASAVTGRIVAYGVASAAASSSALPVRGSISMDAGVASMRWDGAGVEGVVLTATGSVWFVRWGVEPCRLYAAHTGAVSCVAAGPAPCPFVVSGSRQDASLRVWSAENWEQVLSLACQGTAPSAVALAYAPPSSTTASSAAAGGRPAASSGDMQAAAGFVDGSLRLYGLGVPTPASKAAPHNSAVTAVAWIGAGDRRAVVSGDESGRVFLSPVAGRHPQPTLEAATRLDHMHIDDGVATAHKFHAVASLASSPFDPYMFAVATPNGRVTVWSVSPDASRLVAALYTNYTVAADGASAWHSLLPDGVAVDVPSFACFSPVQPSVLVCVGAAAPSDAAEDAPHGVYFMDLSSQSVLQRCLFPEVVSAAEAVTLQRGASYVALAAASSDVYLLSCAPGRLGDVDLIVRGVEHGPVAGLAAAAVPTDDAPSGVLVTAAGESLQVWACPNDNDVVDGDE